MHIHMPLKSGTDWRKGGWFTAFGFPAVWKTCRIDDWTEIHSTWTKLTPCRFQKLFANTELCTGRAMFASISQHWPCVPLLSVLQEIALHAPLPPGLRGPVAGHQQEVSNLPSWHWNTAEPWQLMRFNPVLCQSPSCGSCFLPPRLAGPPSPCWVLCQMSPDFMWHLHSSDSRFTEPSQDN